MESEGKVRAVFYSIKCAAIISPILLFFIALLMLCSCAGKSINTMQDLKKILSEEEVPNDPTLSDEILCKDAGDYAKKNNFNPPVCLYTSTEGNIKARPGGRMGVQNTPSGVAMVMLMVNTGTNPIEVLNKMLEKGEVAIYRSGHNSGIFDIPGIVLKPAQ